MVYIKEGHNFSVKEIKLVHASCLEITFKNITILGIYRSPSNHNTAPFINSLSTHLDSLKSGNNVVIAGDININIIHRDTEKENERQSRLNYLNMVASHGLLPGHSFPTREYNCLDHFVLKIDKSKSSAVIAILNTSLTDHLMILLKLSNVTKPYRCQKTKTVIDYDKAVTALKNCNLTDLMLDTNPNKIADELTHNINKSLEENTKIIKITKNKRVLKPWITVGILRCIRTRNKMQKSLRLDPSNEIIKITFRRYRNFCNNLIKKLRRKYEKEELEKHCKNPKALWKAINEITHYKKTKISNTDLLNYKITPTESVNAVNSYFVNIGKTLAECAINNANYQNNKIKLPDPQPQSFALLNTDPQEVDIILSSLKSESAPGWDGITTKFLKQARYLVVPVVSYLANVCFELGEFPKSLKQSVITPVFKSGDREEVGNYRPISVLTAISKILEKLINNRLINYFNKFNILSKSQFGFRRGLSTEDAVTALASLITDQVDKKFKCLTVFLDLQKAFDTVSIPILINKLENVGIRDKSLALLSSYLQNRTQRVKIGENVSGDEDITYGVPQGSVLGPTLFLIYINDLCNMSLLNGQIFSYADDTAIVFSGKSWSGVQETTEIGLTKVASWLNSNLLTLNTSKTNYICFAPYNSGQPGKNFKVRIHECTSHNRTSGCSCPLLLKLYHTRYLGVVVDQRLSWHPQIESVLKRIRKLVWLFKSLRHIASEKLLKSLYLSLAQSVIVYCIPVWGGATKSKMLDIERAQRWLLKVMKFKPRRFPTAELYNISEVLSVRKLYIQSVIIQGHKSYKYKQNPTCAKRRQPKLIPIPTVRTKFADRQFTKRASVLYNLVHEQLNIHALTLYECKKIVTDWLMDKSYEETENILEII